MKTTELINKLKQLKKWHGGNPEVFLNCNSLEKAFNIGSIIPVGQYICINIIDDNN